MKNHVLIAVDFQKGFVSDESRPVARRVEVGQSHFDRVVFTRFYNPDPSPFRTILGYHKLSPESEDVELALTPREDALIIDRPCYSCVTEVLRDYIKDHAITDAYICGIATEACVFKTVLDLFEANICPWVIKDWCASDQDVYYHDIGLHLIAKLIGRDHVITSGEALSKLQKD